MAAPKAPEKPSKPRSKTSWVWISLIVLIALGVALGLSWFFLWKPVSKRSTIPLKEPEAQKLTLAEKNLVYAGLPKALASDSEYLILRNQGYVVGYSETRKNPLWVSYYLDPKPGTEIYKRPSKFSKDHRTASKVDTKEFIGLDFDRGHMAPNAGIARRLGPEAQKETFLMSNVCPQKPDLNRRLWERLERMEADKLAVTRNGLWVIDGPVFDSRRETIPSGVEIPDEFYRIWIDETDTDVEVEAFLVPQDVTGNETPGKFLTSIEKIQEKTRLDFLWALTDEREKRIEKEVASKLWEK